MSGYGAGQCQNHVCTLHLYSCAECGASPLCVGHNHHSSHKAWAEREQAVGEAVEIFSMNAADSDAAPRDSESAGDESGASGAEWRTAPLWGIGLTRGVSGGEAYLHDGRARSLEEAILWHGGEAEMAKEAFRQLPRADRTALIKFLRSL